MKKSSKALRKKAAGGALAVMMGMVLGTTMVGAVPTTRAQAEGAGAQKPTYNADFATYDELENAGSEVAISIASEGAILLKNDNSALPLNSNEMRVSVFGSYSTKIRQAGGGAGGGSSARSKTLQDSMAAAGFTVNPFLTGYYNTTNATDEIGPGALDAYAASYGEYGGAGIVVISRSGSEMRDIAINYDKEHGTHSMQLSKNEQDLVNYVKAHFDKVVVVLNTPSAMEIAGLHDDQDIDSILWIGLTGAEGIMALGKLLNGEVNPSGRTVDLYMSKFDTDPTWFNVANNAQTTGETLVRGTDGAVYSIPGVTGGFGGAGPNYASIDYEEGIYMGYRFYETAAKMNVYETLASHAVTAATQTAAAKNVYGKDVVASLDNYIPQSANGDVYYNRYNGVLYPYGYGLSYTSFEWAVEAPESLTITEAHKNDDITVKVTVKNTGSVAGKDVVQLYAEPEYHTGGIEKASKNLVTFGKTKLLQPDEEQTLELTVTPFELASFDDVDANGNSFAGYELEAGGVNLYVSKDSHVSVGAPIALTVEAQETAPTGVTAAEHGANGIFWTVDPVSGKEIKAVFSQDDEFKTSGSLNNQYANTRREGDVMADPDAALEFMSRADLVGTYPDAPTAKDVTFSADALEFLDAQQRYFAYMDKESDPWYKSAVPTGWTQVDARTEANAIAAIQLWDMAGIPLEGEYTYQNTNKNGDHYTTVAAFNGKKPAECWDIFMNQLTWDEMKGLVSAMGFNTGEILAIGKPRAVDSDGPAQLGQNSTNTYWPAACVIGATYNAELAELHGIIVGNESIYTNRQGWYAPSMNIHRSPFSGRNFEYYGQDGVHSGIMAAAVIKGVRSKGVVPYIKHFALNDQEQNRQINGGVITWASEQAMREIYLRPYEYCVKKAGANAAMASFNRIGIMPSVNDYAFINSLTIQEWGMDGYAITDMYAGGSTYWPGNIMVRTGSGPLGTYSGHRQIEGVWDATDKTVKVASSWTKNGNNYTEGDTKVASPTQWYAVRTMAMRVLHVAADSNLMNNGDRPLLDRYFGEGTRAGGTGFGAAPAVVKTVEGLKVGEAYSVNYALTDEQKKEFTGVVIGEDRDGNETVTLNVTYALASGTLPDGLTFNASTGELSGTPTKAGEYNVTFTATIGNMTVSKVLEYVVAEGEPGEAPVEPEWKENVPYIGGNGNWFVNGEDTGVAATGPKGDQGDKGDKGDQGDKGAKGSGCGGVIGVGAAAMAGLSILGGAALVLRKKKDDE